MVDFRNRVGTGTARWIGIAWSALLLQGSLVEARPVTGDGVVRFVYADTLATEVFLAGDFNGWSPNATPLDRDHGRWVTNVFLDPGVYQYKFLVNGVWRVDPDNPEVSSQNNSVVRVGADAEVLPPGVARPDAGGASPVGETGSRLGWRLRYIGLVASRLDRTQDRYDLDRPLHDIDLRLDAQVAPEVSGWFLGNLNSLRDGEALSQASLRYDRGLLLWTPQPFRIRFFDNVGVLAFDDPGALVGRVGIYGDDFGFGRRGLVVERKLFGAPLAFLYADDTEPEDDPPPETALPDLHESDAGLLAGSTVQRYVSSASDRNADALAFRARGGTDDRGLGFLYRVDRGASRGRLAEVRVESVNDTLRGEGRELETTEAWRAWGLDLRAMLGKTRLTAEYLSGVLRARSSQEARILEHRGDPGSSSTIRQLGTPFAVGSEFELDRSRKFVLRLVHGGSRSAIGGSGEPRPYWSLRPDFSEVRGPELAYEYEEHDFTGLVTGKPFLMRRHSVQIRAGGRALGFVGRLEIGQDWFRSPDEATWETQFWFRRHNFWLDEDTAGFDRLTLLGAPRAARARLEAAGVVWPDRELRAEGRFTYAAPGFEHAPRYLETVLRFALPVRWNVEFRTHSRLATYRLLVTTDPVPGLGAGTHLETGAIDFGALDRYQHGYRSFLSHFAEIVYQVTDKADLALGFGVDPIVVYEVTNEYADVGWDAFLFGAGASAATARVDPVGLGGRLRQAERALERERRLVLEGRFRF